MRLVILAPLVLCAAAFGQTGNGCSTNTAAASGTVQSFGLCQPVVIDGKNKGGWIALNRSGDQSNTEPECYEPQQVAINNGLLTIQVSQKTKTCHYWPATTGTGSFSGTFSSGFVQMNTFSFTGGDILVRAKGPSGVSTGNLWPAIWMLGANCEPMSRVSADNGTFNGTTCNWPHAGSDEIDIFEQIGSNQGLTKSTCNCFSDVGTCPNPQYTITDSSVNWHVYEVRWVSATSIQWWVDGVHQTGCDSTGGAPSSPMFLQFNIALESSGSNAGTPAAMQIDWVKICSSTCATSNVIFFDDFISVPSQTLIKPLNRMARVATAGTPPAVNPKFTMGVAKNEVPKLK